MTTQTLPDPRLYPASNVNNRLIYLANSVLSYEQDADEQALQRLTLQQALSDLLERDEVLSIAVALNLAPSQAAYRILWQALRAAIEDCATPHVDIFAIPLVLVLGSRQLATLPDSIADVTGLNALLREQGVFSPDAEVFLSGKLLAPDTVVGISPAQLYRFSRHLADVSRGLPLTLPASAIQLKGEGVFLRYLLGLARRTDPAQAAVDLSGKVSAWGMPLMKFLSEALKTDGVTLFPIARAPAMLTQALEDGNRARLEIALQVFMSSLLKSLRSQGHDAQLCVSAHQGGEIHFTVTSPQNTTLNEQFIWPLSPLDDVGQIVSQFQQLMQDCKVEHVRLDPEIKVDTTVGDA